ncbi:MAG: hypothetical protein K0S74_1698 [Chlamydiales bacterium]|jgi:thiamine kinase-like enzyme|nr:hypothetical protein [Chlamydiales bacterium]
MLDKDYTKIITEAISLSCIQDKEIQFIESLVGGLSSSWLYKVRCNSHTVVARITPPLPAEEQEDHQLICSELAAGIGLSPAIYFSGEINGFEIIIMDFVKQISLSFADWQEDDMLTMLANSLRSLHQGPKFPTGFDVFVQIKNNLFQISQYTIPLFSHSLLLDNFNELKEQLQPQLLEAPCHQDLNLQNFLYDGKKVWMIDWEAAAQADPFIDLATICNFVLFDPYAQSRFLSKYFGRLPTQPELSKLILMRKVSFYFYGTEFLKSALLEECHLSINELPVFKELYQQFLANLSIRDASDQWFILGLTMLQCALGKQINMNAGQL